MSRLNKSSQSMKTEKDLPKISIVMPSFNQATFIERSIQSVICQDYPNIELILVDGGSTDGTLDIIHKYKDYLGHFVSEPDDGQSDALNKGFQLASGEIFGWLNSDDLYLPGTFSSIAETFDKHPRCRVVFGDWLSIDGNDSVIAKNCAFDFNLHHFVYEGFHLNSQAMFWVRDVHRRFSGFDVELHNTMDYQMILEFGINAGENAFLRIPVTLAAFRRYEGQKTSGVNDRVISEHKKIARRYGFEDKYSWVGRLKRFKYRFRRLYWYGKREGCRRLMNRIFLYISRKPRIIE